MDLTAVWAFVIAFAVFAYVVMDGFDLGIGILFPALQVGTGRNRAMNSIAPEKSQVFMLIGVAITLPLILGYTAWAYWVFRGKVDEAGYH